nr:hypothetical protein BDOA9_0136390 [Bradyrhizobium sp. DOA9]
MNVAARVIFAVQQRRVAKMSWAEICVVLSWTFSTALARIGAIERTRPRAASRAGLFRPAVNPSAQKYSALPKFGFGVCFAHPGSFLRGDHAVVLFASRACGGRGSVGTRWGGQGG